MGTTVRARRKTNVKSPWALEKSKREALRADKREAILQVAAELFTEKGTELTTMEEIASRLSITKPTIYRLFRDKTSLLQACHERAAELFMDILRDARARGGSAIEQLDYYFRQELHLTTGHVFGRLLTPIAQPDVYSDTSRAVRRMREDLGQGIREIVAEGVARGELKKSLDPKLVTLALFATFNFVYRWYDPRGAYSLDEIADRYFEMFLDGLRT